MTQPSTKAGKHPQTSAQEPRPEGIGPKCPECGNRARLENGDCVYCAAVAAAEQNSRSAADALLLATGRRVERAIDQARHAG